ncbi:hypothetical protein JJB09_10905 [Rhizobium sp. KVB221]|uniref:GtrA family protein n=1 Tax=Rhizobium setariae TaxID=2801340 RepID=A0A936YQA8_9HYPH|nr:hypothetical protein [Rhizobium setariae]MBL0372536.1 hypothetical protein [Rhizobium setariae]
MTDNGKEAASGARLCGSWRNDQCDKPVYFWRAVLLFSLIAIVYQIGAHFLNYKDYIGPDPDDSMRLVEVRDFLGGQGWFDLHQYRLGPAGGTLMHWSRLVDAPIAGLILLFSMFLSPTAAEAAAAFVWPIALVLPLMAATALAGYRIGGRQAMVVALILATVFLTAIIRFRPGAIDHHNLQLVLAIFIVAMLIDPLARASNFALAAIAGAVALAIGAETTPLVAVGSVVVALLWAFDGDRYRRAAIGYGLSFSICTAAIFFGTTPTSLWSAVTCDTLSLGYFAIASAGGFALAAAALFASGRGTGMRLGALVLVGFVTAAIALIIAPQCLKNPLGDLDPLLQTMWLSSISEAQSIIAVAPEDVGGFYAVGLIGVAVCLFRILRRQQATAHAILLALILVSWVISAVQVRGTIFASFLAFVPLSALISDLRDVYYARRNDTRAAAAFIIAVLASIPSVWTISGVMAFKAGDALAGTPPKQEETKAGACVTPQRLKSLASLPPGRILSTSNPGSVLLRYTPHAVLTANYHRNQAGMIAALKMGMAEPSEAWQMMKHEKIGYLLICTDDPQLSSISRAQPSGLFARLVNGEIPEFLEPVDNGGEKRMLVFRVL